MLGWLLGALLALTIILISGALAAQIKVNKAYFEEFKPLKGYESRIDYLVSKFEKVFKTKVFVDVGVYAVAVKGQPGVVGVCIPSLNQVRIIKRVMDEKGRVGALRQEALVFHELLHCHYGLEHARYVPGLKTCPNSIMDPLLLPAQCYLAHKDYYLKEAQVRIRMKQLGVGARALE